jgi:CheY-like chemotaxis protein
MPSVLLIEDDIASIAMLRRALSRSGYQVLVATNHPDAISSAEHEHPAAFLISSTLGGRNGDAAQLVEGLRSIAPGQPLLLLGEDAGTGEQALPRPIQIAPVLEFLRHALSPHTAAAEEPVSVAPAAEVKPAAPSPVEASAPVAPTAAPAPTSDADSRREAAAKTAELAARRRYEQARAAVAAQRKATVPVPVAEAPVAPVVPVPAETTVAAPVTTPPAPRPPVSPPAPRPPPPEPKPVFPPPGLGIPLTGQLEETEVAELIAACAHSKLTGRLQLGNGPGTVSRVLFWDQGRISGAASNSPEERLESLAHRRGLLTREQHRQLRAEPERATRRLALLMVERAYIKAAELFPLVQERVEEIAYEAFGQNTGSYTLDAQTVPDDERVALSRSPLSVMTEGIRRKYLMDRLLSKLSGPATLLRPRTDGPDLAELGLTAKERRMSELVDGLRNIEELLFETGIEPLAGLKTLFSLFVAGHLEIAVRGISAGDAAEASSRIDLGRIEEKHGQVRTANYFEILGVSEKATTYEVQQAYDRLAREFQPSRFGELDRGDTSERLEEIQRVLGEARDVLSDERLRQDYARHMRRS